MIDCSGIFTVSKGCCGVIICTVASVVGYGSYYGVAARRSRIAIHHSARINKCEVILTFPCNVNIDNTN